MRYANKIVSVLAIIIGAMAIITGLRVIGGFYDPGYQYFLTLVSYNVIMGAVSVITGIYIWQRNKHAFLFAKIITLFHTLVLLSLVTIFRDVISDNSIIAMIIRSITWIIITLIIWKINAKFEKIKKSN